MFPEAGVGKYIRSGAMLILGGTAEFLITHGGGILPSVLLRILFRNIAESLFRRGCADLLAVGRHGEIARRAGTRHPVQLVLSMGVYVSLSAGSYAVNNLYPNHGFWQYLIFRWLPFGCLSLLGLYVRESSGRCSIGNRQGARAESMIAALIFGTSFVGLLEFFVIYCRSLIAASRGHELSEQAREICGIGARALGGEQFRRLVQLIGLCPTPGGDSFDVRPGRRIFQHAGIGTYFVGLGGSFHFPVD